MDHTQRNLAETLKISDFSEETIQEKLTAVFKKKTSLDSFWTEIKEICLRCNDINSKISYDDYLQNIVDLSKFLEISGISIPFIEWKTVPKFLKNLKSRKIQYSIFQNYQDSELRSQAAGVEDVLFVYHAILNCLDTTTTEEVKALLQNIIEIKDVISFLGKLKSKTKELLSTSNIISACRATAYVNLYFRIAVLRTLLSLQVLLLQLKSNFDHASINCVIAFMLECKKADKEMFHYVTKIEMKNALFISVFNLTENENFVYFMELYDTDHECKLVRLSQDRNLTQQQFVICLFDQPNIKLKMPGNIQNCISGANDCHSGDDLVLMLRAVKERDLDNIFYLVSRKTIENKTENVYITMNDRNAYCYLRKKKPHCKK